MNRMLSWDVGTMYISSVKTVLIWYGMRKLGIKKRVDTFSDIYPLKNEPLTPNYFLTILISITKELSLSSTLANLVFLITIPLESNPKSFETLRANL